MLHCKLGKTQKRSAASFRTQPFDFASDLFSGTWYGLGKFLRDVPRPQEVIVRDSLLHLWILEFTYAYSLGFSKLSILALYWRFFSLFKIRVPIIILACGTIIWLLCRVSPLIAA